MQSEIVYLYAFDVANEIVTSSVKDILATRPAPFEIRSDLPQPKDLPLYKPLMIEPPVGAVSMRGEPVRLLIRIYEVGVVSITCRWQHEVEILHELVAYHRPVLDDGRTLDSFAVSLCADVCNSLADALVQTSRPTEPEAYTIFCLTEIGPQRDVNHWLAENRRAVAELLTESTPDTLSEAQIAEVMRVQRSYTKTDAIVIDWDAALAIDLDGTLDDVLYVLELANLQLEEYRMMDQRIDRYLNGAYVDLRRLRYGIFGTHLTTLGLLRLFRVDLAKLNDEVTHISKFVGDWYLARVYLGAAEKFYLNQWRQSVESRLSQLDQLYSVVNSDINNRRMLVLEILIVIFFAIDLLLIAFK
jgi:hypothetical protein